MCYTSPQGTLREELVCFHNGRGKMPRRAAYHVQWLEDIHRYEIQHDQAWLPDPPRPGLTGLKGLARLLSPVRWEHIVPPSRSVFSAGARTGMGIVPSTGEPSSAIWAEQRTSPLPAWKRWPLSSRTSHPHANARHDRRRRRLLPALSGSPLFTRGRWNLGAHY